MAVKRHKLPVPTVISPLVCRVPFFVFSSLCFPSLLTVDRTVATRPPVSPSRWGRPWHFAPREGIGNSSRTGTDAARWWKCTTVIISAPHSMPRTHTESIMLQSGSNQQHNKRGTWTEAHNFPFPGHADPCEGKARASDWTAFCNPALTLKEPRALVIQIMTR